MTLADEKEALATIFFECARYERPSTDWIAALDLFATRVAEAERAACAGVCEAQVLLTATREEAHSQAQGNATAHDCANAIRRRSNAGVDHE